MNLDIIFSSLVADKMSREDWGGCGCSPALIAFIVLLYLVCYGSFKAYIWAEDRVLGVVPYGGETNFEVIAARVAIICLIVVFWALLFVLLRYFAGKEEEGREE